MVKDQQKSFDVHTWSMSCTVSSRLTGSGCGRLTDTCVEQRSGYFKLS